MQDDKPSQGTIAPETEQGENQPQSTPEPMPSSNQDQTDAVPTDAPVQSDEYALPEDASERTRKNFEKIREENRILKEQLLVKQQLPPEPLEDFGTSVFDSFRPQQPVQQPTSQGFDFLSQQQVDTITNKFIDDQGNVDINGLNQALSGANRAAQEAKLDNQRLREKIERFEENQEVKDAHSVHKWLDPKSKEFDREKFEQVRDRILRVKYYEGKPITLLDAANAVARATGTPTPNLDKVKEEAVTQYKQTQQNRVQGPIESGKGETRSTTATLQDLRERTQNGDQGAILERLRNVGVIKD